ncbi:MULTISPECIES: phage holin family protein [Yersinia]|uniref:Holin n=4 Tax=Yersinia TaxID=629 RepID=A0A0T7P7S6_YEREN|nr:MULTISPECIES: phage holin family protein [Yersinia]MCE3066102.1 phage holin family protein [Yersinia enterocolitica]MCE3069570.1 phage holin family protein [Yersinia enterocolitica]MCE3079863.1 phage holin family protein [Yersinia enterocolitica]MCE3087892.1 phage holin family protein [Yersinia enterocolitica]MCE3101647.1 phage holin family protein [Yersinia enterocolitica]
MKMPIKEPETYSIIGTVLVLLMTTLGTIANYAWRVINGEKFRWSFFILKFFISIFAGALVLLAASSLNWTAELAGGVAGLSGWSGASAIRAIEGRFLKRIAGTDDTKPQV